MIDFEEVARAFKADLGINVEETSYNEAGKFNGLSVEAVGDYTLEDAEAELAELETDETADAGDIANLKKVIENMAAQGSDETEWTVFEDESEAELCAVDEVEAMFDDMGAEAFTSIFIQQYIEIYPTDKRIIAGAEADSQLEGLDDESIRDNYDVKYGRVRLEEEIDQINSQLLTLDDQIEDGENAGAAQAEKEELEAELVTLQGQLDELGDEEDLDSMREALSSDLAEEIECELDDPIQYFVEDHGMYSLEDLMKADFIHIDIYAAAQASVDADGIAHTLDRYDGSEVEITDPVTGKTFLIYGTN
jgi:hypothetical protein